MLFKKYSSTLILIHSKLQNFAINNMSLTNGLEWIIDKINNLLSRQQTLESRMDTFDSNIESKSNVFIPEDDLTNIEINYISGSVNQYKITRILDDLKFESDEAHLTFTIDHNFGVEPLLTIFTKNNSDDDYSLTIAPYINNTNQTIITFTEPVFVKVIFKL